MFRYYRWALPFVLACTCVFSGESAEAEPQDATSSPQPQSASPATAPRRQQSAFSPQAPTDSVQPQPSAAPPDPLGEAKALVRKGDFDAAIQKYQQLLEERPKSPDAYAGLTRVYLKKKDLTQAHETATKGLQVTDSWPIHVALGEVYFRQGKIREAEKEWVDVINSGHQAARAYFGLARVRWALSMNKSAKAMIEKAHGLDPTDPDIERYWISTLSRRERIRNLEVYLAAAGNGDPERTAVQQELDYLKGSSGSDLSCALVGKVPATETPMVRMLLDPQHLRGYGLSVALNGEKAKLLLDTGAGGILISRGMAERAGVTKLMETRIRGIGDQGSKPGYVAIARSIRIGDLEFKNCTVEVMESRSVVGEDGLIGANVFQSFLVDIDFSSEKLRLRELPKRPDAIGQALTLSVEEGGGDDESSEDATGANPDKTASPVRPARAGPQDRYIAPGMESYTLVYRFGHDLLVPTKVGDTPEKLFLVDTGAIDNMISPDAAREVTKVGRDTRVRLKGISGSVSKVYTANKAVLQFGHLRQENQDMLSFDLSSISDGVGTEVSGTLGFTLLRLLEIKIDYRDGLVDFNYDPKRLIHF
jgi:tetratricopeptide (TPR) repeat protein